MIAKNGALLLALKDYSPVIQSIPTAKVLSFKGKELVAVKHTLDHAKVLRNLGLDAPSPILYDGYEFSGRYSPFENQVKTAEFLTLHNRCFVFNEMRTGKTGAALWAIDYLIQRGYVKRVLVICPLSVMDVWPEQAFSVVPHISVTQLIGTKAKRLEALRSQATINVINFDGVSSFYHEELKPGTKTVKKRWSDLENEFDLIVIDEAEAYCNATTLRYKALKQLLRVDTRLWLLTGTPMPSAPTDAYGLGKLVSPEKLPPSFTLFRDALMKPAGPYKWVPKPNAIETVFEKYLQPAIRFTRASCADLPTTYNSLYCEMSSLQKKVFDDMRTRFKHEDETTEISAVNAAVKLLKLQQIMCGVVKDDDGNPIFLDPKARLELLHKTVAAANAKTVVFVPFIHAMHMVRNYLSKDWSTALVNGSTNKAERVKLFREFQNRTDPHVMVAHPKVVSHGVDLTAADTFIWFGPVFSSGMYEQANARGEGPKKTRPVGIYHIGCHPLEWKIYAAVQGKVSMQSQLLGMYNSVMDE